MPYSNHNFCFPSFWFIVGPNWDFGIIFSLISCLIAIFFPLTWGLNIFCICQWIFRMFSVKSVEGGHLAQRKSLVRGLYVRDLLKEFCGHTGEARTPTAHPRQQVTILRGEKTVALSSRKQVHTKVYLIMWERSRETSKEREKTRGCMMHDIKKKERDLRLSGKPKIGLGATENETSLHCLIPDKRLQSRCCVDGGRGAVPHLQLQGGVILLNVLL